MDHAATEKSQRITLATGGPAVPDGVVRVLDTHQDRAGRRWFLVGIGRGRYTKRFNLTDAEARQLVDALSELLGQ